MIISFPLLLIKSIILHVFNSSVNMKFLFNLGLEPLGHYNYNLLSLLTWTKRYDLYVAM